MTDGTVATDAEIAARERALKRELTEQFWLHITLYVAMMFLPALALYWTRTQAERWLWVGYSTALVGLLIVPVRARWRVAIAVAMTAGAIALQLTVVR